MRKLTKEQQALVERNLRLAWCAVWKTRSIRRAARIEDEDAYMMGCEGLIRAAGLYDPAKGKESTYLYMAALSMILQECRKMNCPSRVCAGLVSLDQEYVAGKNADTVKLIDMLPSKEDTEGTYILRESIAEALGAMSEKERTCILMAYEGKEQKEIGQRVGCSQSYVSRIIRQAQGKARRALETE